MLILCRLDMTEEVIQNDPEKSENFDQDESTQKKFLKRPEREACWRARDIFWDCLTFNKLLVSEFDLNNIESTLNKPPLIKFQMDETHNKCSAERISFEDMCPGLHMSRFDKKLQAKIESMKQEYGDKKENFVKCLEANEVHGYTDEKCKNQLEALKNMHWKLTGKNKRFFEEKI